MQKFYSTNCFPPSCTKLNKNQTCSQHLPALSWLYHTSLTSAVSSTHHYSVSCTTILDTRNLHNMMYPTVILIHVHEPQPILYLIWGGSRIFGRVVHFGKNQPKSHIFHEKTCHFKEIPLGRFFQTLRIPPGSASAWYVEICHISVSYCCPALRGW